MHAVTASSSFLITPNVGLMIWTLVVFAIALFILSKAVYPRIAKVLEVTVTPHPERTDERRHLVDILVRVQPAGAAESVTIGPFTLRFAS